MRKIRFTIGGLMAVVLVLAIGFTALKSANETWAGVMFLLTCGVLGLAAVGAVCRREAERAWWLGFAIFGWGYMVLAFWPSESLPKLPTLSLLEVLGSKFGAAPQFYSTWGMGSGMMGALHWSSAGVIALPSSQIGHCLWALLSALLGGLLARALFGSPADRREGTDLHAQPSAQSPPIEWLRPAVVILSASILVTSVIAIWARSAAGVWAGAAFLLTCGLLGVVILGALFTTDRRREVCMGAALFGIGYLFLAFGRFSSDWPRPGIATDPLLNAIRPWFPPVPRSIVALNARIMDELDKPVSMSFANETPLDDVLKYIQQATSSPSYSGIPIYVDPLGLQQAERSLNSTVQVDLAGVPLKTTLRLCLKQLGLGFSVRDGYLHITSEEAVSTNLEDPFLIVGHSLQALLAALIGGVAAPPVAAARRERSVNGEIAGASATRRDPELQAGR